MANIQELEAALVKADAAGAVDDAKAFASEIRKLRGSPQPAARPNAATQIANDHITQGAQAAANQTPAQAIAGNPVTRFAVGAADPLIGAYQLFENINPVSRAIGYTDKLNDYIGQFDRIVQAGRSGYGSEGLDLPRIAGNILSPANRAATVAIGGSPTLAKNVLGGAGLGAMNPVVDGEVSAGDFAAQKGVQAGIGGIGGAVATGVSKIARPVTPTDSAKKLMSEGVVPTPGQAAGADSVLGRVEQKMMSIPIIGDIIKSARDRATSEFNVAAINRALPKDDKGAVTSAGRAAIEKADDLLGSAYDKVYGSITVKPDTSFTKALATIRSDPEYALPKELQAKFSQIVQQQVFGRIQNGELPGMVAQRADSQLGRLAREYTRSQDADQRMLGIALRDAQKAFKEMVERNAGPEAAETIRGLNRNYADFLRVERAASMQGAREGVFSGDNLSSAVRALDQSGNKGRFAQGNAVMQDLSDAGKTTLGGTVSNSGTIDRATLASLLGLGGAGVAGVNEYYGGPGYLTALAAAPAIYSRTGSKYAAGGFQGQGALADLLNRLAPSFAQGAVGTKRETRK